VKRSQKRKRTMRKIEEEEEEEAKGCGAMKNMKGVRHYAMVRQLRVSIFNIYMYIYYSDGAGRVPGFFTTRTHNPPRPARISQILNGSWGGAGPAHP
jgi:hypothetical protein